MPDSSCFALHLRMTPPESSLRRRAIKSTLAVISFKISKCRMRKSCAVAGDDLLRDLAAASRDFLHADITSSAMSSNTASCSFKALAKSITLLPCTRPRPTSTYVWRHDRIQSVVRSVGYHVSCVCFEGNAKNAGSFSSRLRELAIRSRSAKRCAATGNQIRI